MLIAFKVNLCVHTTRQLKSVSCAREWPKYVTQKLPYDVGPTRAFLGEAELENPVATGYVAWGLGPASWVNAEITE